MRYEQIVTQKIEYSLQDIMDWVKMFSSRQLNITPDEINNDMININPDNLENTTITVTFTKLITKESS